MQNIRKNLSAKPLRMLLIALMLPFLFVILFSCGKTSELLSLEVTPPTKTEYYVGEAFNPAGMIVKALYSVEADNKILSQNEYILTGFDSTITGDKTITVSYQTKSTEFSISVTSDSRKIVTTTTVNVYDIPEPLETSANFKAKVNGVNLFVYETLVNHQRTFSWVASKSTVPVAMFDFEGKVKVSIEVVGVVITKASVKPLAYGIDVSIVDNKIEFDLEYPANYTIEYNDPSFSPATQQIIQGAFHLFANPLEDSPITKEEADLDDDIIYIGPGVYKTDTIPLESGKTVYIAGGAVLYGQFNGYGLKDITIKGRGIISGSIYERTTASEKAIPMEFQNSSNIYIEGISFLDPAGWTIHMQNSSNITIENVKIITGRPNGDGISVQSCKDVIVTGSFVRTWDDSLVVKNVRNNSTENVTFRDCILWTDLAQSMEIGYEAYGEYIKNVVFENITVLHNYHKPVMSIHNADQAAISDIIFRNITVEDAQMIGDNWQESYDNFLIDLDIRYNAEWSSSKDVRGTIDNVTFDNILVLDGRDDISSRINGNAVDKAVSNIVFSNIKIKNVEIKNANDLSVTTNDYVRNVSYSYTMTPTGAEINQPYILRLSDTNVALNQIIAENQDGIIVPDFALKNVPRPYAGVEITGDYTYRATHGVDKDNWGENDTNEYSLETNPVANVSENNNNLWISKPFTYSSTSEYVALTVNFSDTESIGTVRIIGNNDSNLFQMQNIAIYTAQRDENGNLKNFLRQAIAANYEFSSSSGNYIDIKIRPNEIGSLQIRFYSKSGVVYASHAFASKIEFYPASLSYGKSVYASEYEDVYDASKLTDGDLTTYFESKKGIFPAFIAIDLEEVMTVKYINLHLPPLSSWPSRTQEIQVEYSTMAYGENTTYQVLITRDSYYFDAADGGNMVAIILPEGVSLRTIKLVFYTNSSQTGEAAQLSEINVY